MRWTQVLRLTNATSADGEVVWFWRPDAGAKSFARTSLRERRRWQESPVTGKSTKETVTPSRRESRTAPVEPVVLPPCFLLHGTHGCNQHPAFPAPSIFEEGETRRKARALRAARMRTHILSHTLSSCPAKAGHPVTGSLSAQARPPLEYWIVRFADDDRAV